MSGPLATGVVLVALLLGAALVLGRSRGARSALALVGFHLPQVALLTWIVGDLARWGLGTVAAAGAVAALALLLAHRIRTYTGRERSSWGRPARGDLPWFSLVHVAQTAILSGLIVWPASRLFPAGVLVDVAAIAALVTGSAVALVWTHTALARDERNIDVPGLPAPLRVVQVSDLHVGPYTPPARLHRIAADITALRPDLIALTGDLLTLRSERDPSALYAFVEALPHALHGTWACLGNHDVDAAPTLVPALEARGVRVLVDAAVDLDDAGVRIIGLDWRWRRDREGYAPAFERLAPTDGRPVVLLCHDPAVFDRLPRGWRGVMLAGHLHGGQVGWRLGGRSFSLLGLFGSREQGLHRRDDAALYVHRGTGTYGFPVRIGIPPEVAVLGLRSDGARPKR